MKKINPKYYVLAAFLLTIIITFVSGNYLVVIFCFIFMAIELWFYIYLENLDKARKEEEEWAKRVVLSSDEYWKLEKEGKLFDILFEWVSCGDYKQRLRIKNYYESKDEASRKNPYLCAKVDEVFGEGIELPVYYIYKSMLLYKDGESVTESCSHHNVYGLPIWIRYSYMPSRDMIAIKFPVDTAKISILNFKDRMYVGKNFFMSYNSNYIHNNTDILEIDYSPQVVEQIEKEMPIGLQQKHEREEQERLAAEERMLAEEVRIEKERLLAKRRRELVQNRAMNELMDEGLLFPEAGKRPPIPKDVADAVWLRDGGKCVYCGGTQNLQFDHIIPFSKGGATTIENLQLLCRDCNLKKSNHIG